MLLAVIILISAGIYVCAKRSVQASSSFVIQGRPAQHIGIALILGGALAVILPVLFGALGLFKGFVGSLLLSIAAMFTSLIYIGVIMAGEKSRQRVISPGPRVLPGKLDAEPSSAAAVAERER